MTRFRRCIACVIFTPARRRSLLPHSLDASTLACVFRYLRGRPSPHCPSFWGRCTTPHIPRGAHQPCGHRRRPLHKPSAAGVRGSAPVQSHTTAMFCACLIGDRRHIWRRAFRCVLSRAHVVHVLFRGVACSPNLPHVYRPRTCYAGPVSCSRAGSPAKLRCARAPMARVSKR